MKKSVLLIGIIAWVAVILAAILIMGGVLRGGFFLPDNSKLLKEEETDLFGISDILIETDSLDIEFVVGQGPRLKVRQYGAEKTTAEELFSLSQKDGVLRIGVKNPVRIFSVNFGLNERLTLEIPAEWLGNVSLQNSSGNISLADAFTWQNVSLSSYSGDLRVTGELCAEEISLHITSGNVVARQGLTATKLNISTTSGDIRLNGILRARTFNAKTVSGNIVIEQAEAERYDLHASSGDIRAKLSGGGAASATSGNINLSLTAPLGDVELDTSSGDISLSVEQDISFDFSGLCSSGDIYANFPLQKNERGNRAAGSVGHDPSASIRAEAASGNIRIERAE